MGHGSIIEEIEFQKKRYNEELENEFRVTRQERHQVVRSAVNSNRETPHDYKCQICMQTLFEPKECVSCEVATFCTPCIE